MSRRARAAGAGLAGTALVVMPMLDLLVGGGGFGPVHAIVGCLGMLILGVAAGAADGEG